MHAASLPLVAWLVWALWVVAHYFTIPDTPLLLLDGPIVPPDYNGPAAARAVRALAGASLVLAAGWGAGALAARPFLRVSDDRVERTLVRLALGCAALAYGFLALAFAGAFTRPVAAAVLAAGAVAGIADLVRALATRQPRAAARWTALDAAFAGCAILAAAFALVAALAPETEYDALWYHLWLPVRWLDAGRPVDIVEEYVSLYPLTWDLLYGGAIVAGGPIAARLLHFACLPLLGIATWRLTRALFPRANAVLAAALATTAPLVVWEASTAYNDLALAWYVTLGVHALARWEESRARRWLVLASILFGIGASIKHLGLVPAAIAAAWVGASSLGTSRSIRRALLDALLPGALALAIASPWYARAAAASGNPVFPELYSVFGASPESRWSDATEQALGRFEARFGRERTFRNLALLPWDMTVHGAAYGGTLGPLFLVLVPLALGAGRRARVLAAIVAVYLAIWASPFSSFQMRFVVPIVPVLGALAAEGARTIPGAAVIAIPLMIANLPPFTAWHEADRRGWQGWLTHVLRESPLPVVVGMESEPAYLARRVPSYRAWRFVNRELPAGARVLTFSGGDHLYSARARLWSDAAAAFPLTWNAARGEEREVRAGLAARGITHVLFDRRQLDSGALASVAIASEEMRRCCLERVYEDNRFALYAVR